MIKKAVLSLGCLVILYGCGPATSRSGGSPNSGLIEIIAYKETEVILKDTMQVRTAFAKSDSGRVSMYEFANDYSKPAMYLNRQQFANFEKAVWQLIKDPKSKVYHNADFPPLTKKELKDKFTRCDSIDQISYDAKGNEERALVFVCDSTSLMTQINKIVFFESWYFNPANNMIERDVLAYSVWAYMLDKEAWRELFMVFRDEEALKQVKKYR